MYDIWHSENLVYRAVEKDDEPFLSRFHADARSHLNACPWTPKPLSTQDAEGTRTWLHDNSLIAVIMCLPQPPEAGATDEKKTYDRKGAIPIGHIKLSLEHQRYAHHRRAEIAISILPEHQGQGHGSEAIRWILRWGFRFGNLHRIGIRAFEWNAGALRLYERLGFVREGAEREALWFDGRYWDFICLGMLDREWKARYDRGEEGKSEVISVVNGV